MKNLFVVMAVAGLALMALPMNSVSVPMAPDAPVYGQCLDLFGAILMKADQWSHRALNGLFSGSVRYAADNGEEEEKEEEPKKDDDSKPEVEPPDRLWNVVQLG